MEPVKGRREEGTTKAGLQLFFCLCCASLYCDWYLMLSKNCKKTKFLLHNCTAICTKLTVLQTPPGGALQGQGCEEQARSQSLQGARELRKGRGSRLRMSCKHMNASRSGD